MPGGRHRRPDTGALAGLAVLDLSGDLAGAYCTKILADLGADVVMVEPPGGARLRRWSASGALGRDGDRDGALFRYLAASKLSVAADVDEPAKGSAGSRLQQTWSSSPSRQDGSMIWAWVSTNSDVRIGASSLSPSRRTARPAGNGRGQRMSSCSRP
jgi:hypothetical protein